MTLILLTVAQFFFGRTLPGAENFINFFFQVNKVFVFCFVFVVHPSQLSWLQIFLHAQDLLHTWKTLCFLSLRPIYHHTPINFPLSLFSCVPRTNCPGRNGLPRASFSRNFLFCWLLYSLHPSLPLASIRTFRMRSVDYGECAPGTYHLQFITGIRICFQIETCYSTVCTPATFLFWRLYSHIIYAKTLTSS